MGVREKKGQRHWSAAELVHCKCVITISNRGRLLSSVASRIAGAKRHRPGCISVGTGITLPWQLSTYFSGPAQHFQPSFTTRSVETLLHATAGSSSEKLLNPLLTGGRGGNQDSLQCFVVAARASGTPPPLGNPACLC